MADGMIRGTATLGISDSRGAGEALGTTADGTIRGIGILGTIADGTADGMEAGTADGMTRGATEDGDTVLTTSTTATSSARAAAGSTHRG